MRQDPTYLTTWFTPLSAVVAVFINIPYILLKRLSFLEIVSLVFLFCEVAIIVPGWLLFSYHGPFKVPSVYEPVCEDTRQAQEDLDDGSAALADAFSGICANLFQVQRLADSGTRAVPVESFQSENIITVPHGHFEENHFCALGPAAISNVT
ncbi:hypothetical protein G7Y89_g4524 [Cudoniella acicularis]|uniref:Uncharacterized protein n=1 Tax=Cudoniella acicularis TaxID=354080 RepID=A0A8H4RPA0_9HELO|nr:hypothetical protein G7Y89_g4524 [Cudoniella acicularis]